MPSHKRRVPQRGPFNLTKRTAVRAQNIRAAHRQRQTQTVKSAIVTLMADEEAIQRKRDLLEIELQRYFGETCPTLAARWEVAIIGLAPPALRELVGRLQTFETLTEETSRQLKAAAFEDEESAEHLLDRALASMENLTEVADAMTRRLDELLK
jgi:hypothetical protein